MGVQGGSNENDYDIAVVDLGVERLEPTMVYQFSGGTLLSTTITALDGMCSIGFNDPGNPLMPLSPLTYPQTICFIFTHSSIYIQNTQQTGKLLKLWIGRST
jgi:hypothetical protein